MSATELPQIVDLRQSPTALKVQRGVMRLLRATYDFCCFAEVPQLLDFGAGDRKKACHYAKPLVAEENAA